MKRKLPHRILLNIVPEFFIYHGTKESGLLIFLLNIITVDTSRSYLRAQGMVDNNLGPDRLAGPKSLDPNYCRLPTL